MKTEEEIRERLEKELKAITAKDEFVSIMTACAWFKALKWVLEEGDK